jgi:hypothetical protein
MRNLNTCYLTDTLPDHLQEFSLNPTINSLNIPRTGHIGDIEEAHGMAMAQAPHMEEAIRRLGLASERHASFHTMRNIMSDSPAVSQLGALAFTGLYLARQIRHEHKAQQAIVTAYRLIESV